MGPYRCEGQVLQVPCEVHIRVLILFTDGTRTPNATSTTTSSMTSMLTTLHWNTLKERRMQNKSAMLYSIVHDLIILSLLHPTSHQ